MIAVRITYFVLGGMFGFLLACIVASAGKDDDKNGN